MELNQHCCPQLLLLLLLLSCIIIILITIPLYMKIKTEMRSESGKYYFYSTETIMERMMKMMIEMMMKLMMKIKEYKGK